MAQAALAVPDEGLCVGTFTEQVAQVPAGMRTTTRLRTALAVAVEDGRDQSEVAASHGASWPTVQRAVVVHALLELVEPEPTTMLGMDETRFGRPRWVPNGVHDGPGEDGRKRWRRTDPWETGFVDITGDQRLLGQVDGRTSVAVQAWLAGRSPEFRAGIEVVVIDPHAGYGAAVRAAARGRHRHEIHQRLDAFYQWCAGAQIPELTTLGETIETWWLAIEVFLTTGLTTPAPKARTV